MTSKSPKASQGRERFGVSVKRHKLTISIPRELNEGDQKPLYIGLEDTPENWVIAEAIAARMRRDYALGELNPDLNSYKPQNQRILKTEKRLTLVEIFRLFKAVREKDRACSTIRNGYRTNLNHLTRSPYASVQPDTDRTGYAQGLCDWATGNLSRETAYRLIVSVNACIKWAMKSRLVKLKHSPFEGMASDIKPRRSRNDEDHIDPFTRAERDAVLEWYRLHPHHGHYYLYLMFCFFCGCRPGEAQALWWETVSKDFKSFTFTHAMADSESGRVRKKGLKTQSERTINSSNRLIDILSKAKLKAVNHIVFPSIKGTEIHRGTFNATWKQSLTDLGIQYRKPYQTRHTFIDLCVEQGVDVNQIAKMVGNTPEMILRCYVNRNKRVTVPEL